MTTWVLLWFLSSIIGLSIAFYFDPPNSITLEDIWWLFLAIMFGPITLFICTGAFLAEHKDKEIWKRKVKVEKEDSDI
jgi:Na+/proline symporter